MREFFSANTGANIGDILKDLGNAASYEYGGGGKSTRGAYSMKAPSKDAFGEAALMEFEKIKTQGNKVLC